jgi:hypothetical protein
MKKKERKRREDIQRVIKIETDRLACFHKFQSPCSHLEKFNGCEWMAFKISISIYDGQ